MRSEDRALLNAIEEMEKDAPGVGLCAYPFKILRDQVSDIISEREDLASYRTPMKPNSYKLYAGQCPRCGVVFLDCSTNYCGNCGQALDWGESK